MIFKAVAVPPLYLGTLSREATLGPANASMTLCWSPPAGDRRMPLEVDN